MSPDFLAIMENVFKEHRQAAQQLPLTAPQGFTLRDEANVLVAYAVRNGFLKDIQTGMGGFSDEEMKKLITITPCGLCRREPLAGVVGGKTPYTRSEVRGTMSVL